MKKNNSKKGFSLPLSMVFLLVTVMLSMVLVSAAMSALAQVKKNKEDKQASLTVTSTAAVLANTISGMEFQIEGAEFQILSNNGNSDLANFIASNIKNAAQVTDAENKYVDSNLKLQLQEPKTDVITATLTFYSLQSKYYPGDIVVSLELGGSDKTSDYKTTFRIDGWLDETNQILSFGDVTYYSGSGVYQ